jgi:hypothetical protein
MFHANKIITQSLMPFPCSKFMFVQNTTALSILMSRSRYVCRHGRVKLFCHVSEELPMYMNNLGHYIGYHIASNHHPQNRMWECKEGYGKKDTASHWNPMSMHQFLHLSHGHLFFEQYRRTLWKNIGRRSSI